jgi:hypothetical protein
MMTIMPDPAEAARLRVADEAFMAALVYDAIDALFEVVTEAFPEIHSGDLTPTESITLYNATHAAIVAWVYANLPRE